ncbi:UDP-glucose 4-epimerase GalE [Helicobacter muridarum]|uniref:UDP-glucose 4-epimerase n=1 Tax=Helicobacter muridarum TaxID=216 RepID=A0A099TVP7_9HELI|nr:UDP-glucose 4-epimerase GalE [Helicobacter muridarum]TLD99599.1 UDP-glucose 4-epimerase GalE [Helicobacter muridarum]STQ86791.1 UDP-glucose 4-epimerase [Helicobacter muridarum]
MKLLFTGACGYIGSHCAYNFLANTDVEVIIVDNISTGFLKNYEYLKHQFGDRVRLIREDIENSEEIFKQYKIWGVLHFAASISIQESMENPILYYHNNTSKTLKLLSLCVKYKIKNFILSSTAAVYGEPDAEKMPITEKEIPNPINPYGYSKFMSETMLEHVAESEKINYVILRYFNVAGANTQNDYTGNISLGQRAKNATHLIKVACECATGKRDGMSIYGTNYHTKDGTCIRDYIHVDDLSFAHIEAFKLLQNAVGHFGEIFNVGYGRGFSVYEVIECVKAVSKNNFKTYASGRRVGDSVMLIADNSKLLKLTQWKPRFDDLRLIIESAYNWELFLMRQEMQ